MLPSRSLRQALLAIALSAACAAHAEAPAVSRNATDLYAVKVTAERTHTDAGALGDRALRDTPFAITAVGREQIEQRQVVSLGEAFLLDPSVSTQVSAYASGWSSPIRN
uniref:Plug domain-containing protein n=1 Tax=Stenotrophomonas maltophilia TaxID=40324 RepID=UPI002B1E68DD